MLGKHLGPSTAASVSTVSRRKALLAAAPILLVGRDAHAGPVGDAVGTFWKGRQQANAGKIIAPIKAAKAKLEEANRLLEAAATVEGYAPVLQAVRASSMTCYLFEALPDDSLETKGSMATLQFNKLADPCTFRLIVKNVAGLSSEKERLQGEQLVALIIRDYQKLDGELEAAVQGSAEAPGRAWAQLQTTMSDMQQLEQYVQTVLAV